MIRFVELFAGIGGFRLGLERNSMRCVWANDFDKHAAGIYRANFGGNELFEGDIRGVDAGSIPDHDLLTGGFPCQPFSTAGKRKGTLDPRGTLFWEICRILEAKRPKVVLLENVPGLLSIEGGETFAQILHSLGELGYVCEWQVLDSQYYGVPQHRERVFIVGYLGAFPPRTVFPISAACGSPYQAPREAEGERPWVRNGNKGIAGALSARYYKDGSENLIAHTLEAGYSKNKSFTNMIEIGTMTGQDIHDVAIPEAGRYRIRRLTPTECERLQGFPDGWTAKGLTEGGKEYAVSDTQRYKCIGNAVTVNVIEFLGRRISEALQSMEASA